MANICQKCGVTGRSNHLIHCYSCKIAAKHWYCLNNMPNDDELQVHWLCEQCKARIHKLAFPSKLKCGRSTRIPKHKCRKIEHANICRDKYGFMESKGSYESIKRPSSSNVASALEIDQPCDGLLQKEIQNVVDSSSKCVKDEKPRTHKRRLILAEEEEVDDENCRHSSSKVTEDVKSKRQRRQLILTQEDQLDEVAPFHCVDQKVHSESRLQANGPLLSSENALDIAIKSKIQSSAADEATNKLQNGSLEASKPQAMMQTETHDSGRNISGHQKYIDHQYYELARPVIDHVWRGSFEILNEAYGPIKAHLSERACEKVCITAAILPPVLQMVKLSKLDAWPRSFGKSTPNGDNIALYFFPDHKRAKSMLDHLIWDLISKKLVLKLVLHEAELLLFPSIVLPEVYRRFQGHYYLWGAFKRRQIQTISSEPARCCSMANEIPARKKLQDLELAEEDIDSHHQKSFVVGVAEKKQRADDFEPSGVKDRVEAFYEKPSDVVKNEKLDEEKQKVDDSKDAEEKEEVKVCDESTSNITVDGNAADQSNYLVIFGKKFPVTSMLCACPSEDVKMKNWEQGKETEEKQLHYESTENYLLLFPLQAENLACKSTVGGGTELDLELRLGSSAGDNGCLKCMSNSDSSAIPS